MNIDAAARLEYGTGRESAALRCAFRDGGNYVAAQNDLLISELADTLEAMTKKTFAEAGQAIAYDVCEEYRRVCSVMKQVKGPDWRLE